SQSLDLLNSNLVLEWAQAFAGRILNDSGLTPQAQIERAFKLAYGRAPNAEEQKFANDFLAKQMPIMAERLASDKKPLMPANKPRAKNIIWCFMEGGPSQVDLFDPKPMLEKLALQPVPPSFKPETLLTAQGAKPSDGLFPARRPFKQYGQSGMWVSYWLPNIA